jgi:formylmethanofuran dehydrogenase subunit E
MDAKVIDTATVLHGHLSPGVALGLRMTEIALSKLNLPKGSKLLFGVSETNRCLPDAVQVGAGCTLGHNNILIVNYGKLALTLANNATKEGVRVALGEAAQSHSSLMANWMLRTSKLSKQEEHELSLQLLTMDEKYFVIQNVKITVEGPRVENDSVIKCVQCHEFFPSSFATLNGDKAHCKACSKTPYYTIAFPSG